MISTKLHWIDAPAGKMAVSARPRGGDWLESEMFAWKSLGIDIVVSLLEKDEETELELIGEREAANLHGLRFVSFPIPDRGVPASWAKSAELLEGLQADLESGRRIAIHCRQGVGRAGMIAASLLTLGGMDPETAIKNVTSARGVTVPETQAQREWIASAFAHR